jgi:Lysylphosphatidylglycerol synthase TM region
VRILRRLALSLAIAGVLLWLLAVWAGVGPEDLWGALRRLDRGTYLTALSVHVGIYTVRSLRYAALIPAGQRPRLLPMWACSAAHNLAAYILPAKTGEATLVLYLRSLAGVPAASGLACLVVARLLDLAVLGVSVGGVLLLLAPRFKAAPWMGAAGSASAGLGLGFTLLCLRPHWPALLATRLLGRLGLESHPFGARLLARAGEVTAALRLAASGPRLLLAWLLTAGTWALVFQFYAVLARGTGLPADLSYPEACLGSSLAVLFNLLPINGFAGFGTQEAGWKIGFGLLGVPADLALASGLAAHLVQLANVVLFGLLGHLWMGLFGGQAATPAAVSSAARADGAPAALEPTARDGSRPRA